MLKKYRNNNNSNFRLKTNIVNINRSNDFMNQNNTHILIITYTIYDDEIKKDDEY